MVELARCTGGDQARAGTRHGRRPGTDTQARAAAKHRSPERWRGYSPDQTSLSGRTGAGSESSIGPTSRCHEPTLRQAPIL